MALEGNLETFYLSSLFQLLSNDKKTGRLRITNDDDVVTVNFSEGTIVFATSTENEKHLGYLLRSEGIIGDIELENYLLIARNRKEKLGKVLVDEACITKEDLHHFIYMQTENILFGIFTWPKGKFRFEDCPITISEDTDTQFDTMELILEASRRVDELSVLQEQIPAKDQILKYSARASGSEEKKKLTMQENSVLRLVNGTRTVKDIIHQSGYDEFTASKAVFTLMSCGLIEVVDKVDFSLTASLPQSTPTMAEKIAGKDDQYSKISSQIQSLYEKNIIPPSRKKNRLLMLLISLLITAIGGAGAYYFYTTVNLEQLAEKISAPAVEPNKPAPVKKQPATEQPLHQQATTQSLQDKNSYYFLNLPSGFTSEDKTTQRKSHIMISYGENVSLDIEARPWPSKWNAEDEMYKEIAEIQTTKTGRIPPSIDSYSPLSIGGAQGYKIMTSENINAIFWKTHYYRFVAYHKMVFITVFCKDCKQHGNGTLFDTINEMIEKSLLIYP